MGGRAGEDLETGQPVGNDLQGKGLDKDFGKDLEKDIGKGLDKDLDKDMKEKTQVAMEEANQVNFIVNSSLLSRQALVRLLLDLLALTIIPLLVWLLANSAAKPYRGVKR